jgi:hypothetical protein
MVTQQPGGTRPSAPKIGDGVERVQQAAVRDVGCDVVSEDLIDTEFGGAGHVMTD